MKLAGIITIVGLALLTGCANNAPAKAPQQASAQEEIDSDFVLPADYGAPGTMQMDWEPSATPVVLPSLEESDEPADPLLGGAAPLHLGDDVRRTCEATRQEGYVEAPDPVGFPGRRRDEADVFAGVSVADLVTPEMVPQIVEEHVVKGEVVEDLAARIGRGPMAVDDQDPPSDIELFVERARPIGRTEDVPLPKPLATPLLDQRVVLQKHGLQQRRLVDPLAVAVDRTIWFSKNLHRVRASHPHGKVA